MKLRLRENSLRLRLNRPEVENLAAGGSLEESVEFPGNARLSYVLQSAPDAKPAVSFQDGIIRICAPDWVIKDWAKTDAIGVYLNVPAGDTGLKVAIEKDLECIDVHPEERDPDAFPRAAGKIC